MAGFDIDYSNVPGGRLLQTQYGVGNAGGPGGGMQGGFSGSMSGPGMPDMTAFYQAMAAKQAEQENYRRQQAADALARQNEAMQYDRRQQENAQKYGRDQDARKRIMMDNQMEMMRKQQGIPQTQADEQHWFKNFGIGKGGDFGGPVEVAPGTFGAYRASIGATPGTADAAAKRGLTPGLAGQKLGGVDTLLGRISGEDDVDENGFPRRKDDQGRMNAGQAWGMGIK